MDERPRMEDRRERLRASDRPPWSAISPEENPRQPHFHGTGTINVESFSVENSKEHPGESIYCSWGAVKDAEGYKIRCKGEDRAVVLTATKDAKSLTIRSLTPKTKYQVAIKALGKTGYGPYTNPEEIYAGLGTPTAVNSRVLNGNEILVTFVEAIGASEHKIILSSTEDKERETKVKRGQTNTKFDRLDFNMEYSAVVTALYEQDESQTVESNTVLTAPPAPDVRDISSIAVEKYLDSAFTLSLRVDSSTTSCQAQIECTEGDLDKNVVQMHINRENKKACFTYNGLNKGVLYRVKIRTENSGGYSDWSRVKLIKTAPKKIDPLKISFKGDKIKIEATWENVRHISSNTIMLFQAGEMICTKRDVKSPFVFPVEIEHGLEYHCEIYPENATGKGRRTMSNVIIAPLLPPEHLKMFDEIVQARFEWKRSVGMRSAKIRFSNSKFEETDDITQKCTWTSPHMTDGEVYTFTVWATNGKTLSPGFLTEKYVTAPLEVILKRNPFHPETNLAVKIVTNYNGPFLVTWFNSEEKVKASVRDRCFTIESLKPSTEYRVYALCIYGDSLDRRSQKCFSHKVMTLPAKVTGVRCICVSSDECKQLVWNGCGNKSVQYTLNWARNDVFFKPITTTKETCIFKNLEPGKYSFRVSAGGGKQSDECFIIIPDAPQMELEVLSCQKLRVVFSSKTSASEKYLVKIMKGPLIFESDTAECELIVDQDHFAFEKGVRYTVTSKAYCGDQSGPATKKECMLGLENPTEFDCKMNHHDPHRPVKFTWKNSPGMFAAKIKLRDMDNRLNVEDTTSNFRWEYYGLEPNKTYEFSLWPGDGKRFFYDDCIVLRFTTVPRKIIPLGINCDDEKSVLDKENVSHTKSNTVIQLGKGEQICNHGDKNKQSHTVPKEGECDILAQILTKGEEVLVLCHSQQCSEITGMIECLTEKQLFKLEPIPARVFNCTDNSVKLQLQVYPPNEKNVHISPPRHDVDVQAIRRGQVVPFKFLCDSKVDATIELLITTGIEIRSRHPFKIVDQGCDQAGTSAAFVTNSTFKDINLTRSTVDVSATSTARSKGE